jgi:hypothetical protein
VCICTCCDNRNALNGAYSESVTVQSTDNRRDVYVTCFPEHSKDNLWHRLGPHKRCGMELAPKSTTCHRSINLLCASVPTSPDGTVGHKTIDRRWPSKLRSAASSAAIALDLFIRAAINDEHVVKSGTDKRQSVLTAHRSGKVSTDTPGPIQRVSDQKMFAPVSKQFHFRTASSPTPRHANQRIK